MATTASIAKEKVLMVVEEECFGGFSRLRRRVFAINDSIAARGVSLPSKTLAAAMGTWRLPLRSIFLLLAIDRSHCSAEKEKSNLCGESCCGKLFGLAAATPAIGKNGGFGSGAFNSDRKLPGDLCQKFKFFSPSIHTSHFD